MSRPDLTPLAEEERTDLLALLRELTPEEWDAPTLCPRWRVREVVTHVVGYDELSLAATASAFLRGGLRPAAVNEVVLARYRDLEPAGIVDLVARRLRPSGLPAGLRGGIALTDGTIHHQDVRRALGRPRAVPAHRLVPVLDFSLAAPTLPSRRNARGLRVVATDVDWSRGAGPVVEGPGEALLMALAGRPQALDDLTGPGLATLRQRVG